jgi:hypothetical protein
MLRRAGTGTVAGRRQRYGGRYSLMEYFKKETVLENGIPTLSSSKAHSQTDSSE